MPYEIQVKTIKKQRFSTLHDSIKPHDYPSDWNKPHDTLFDQNMGGIKQTCGINQPCGQYRTQEYICLNHGPRKFGKTSSGTSVWLLLAELSFG